MVDDGHISTVTEHGWDVHEPVCCGRPVRTSVMGYGDRSGWDELVSYDCAKCDRWTFAWRRRRRPSRTGKAE
jgi:hypothetical protein